MSRKDHLPSKVRVKVVREKSGNYFAELPEYDVFTEAGSVFGLIFNINDLIYTLFDIPKRDRAKVWYAPPFKQRKQEEFPVNPVLFKAFIQPNLQYDFK